MKLKKLYENIEGDADYKAYYSDSKVQRFWQRKRVKEIVNMAPKGRVLDIGCGSGVICRQLASRGNLVTGMDFSTSAIQFCEKNKSENESYLIGDASQLPFTTGSFDVIISSEVIEHLPDPKRFLDEIARVLKDDGTLILSTPNYLSPWPIIEYLWDWFGKGRGYVQQHISKFNYFSIQSVLSRKFSTRKKFTRFFLSPFIAILSYSAAVFISKVEDKLLDLLPLGMITFIRAERNKTGTG